MTPQSVNVSNVRKCIKGTPVVMANRWKFDTIWSKMYESYEEVTTKKFARAIKSECKLAVTIWKVTEGDKEFGI